MALHQLVTVNRDRKILNEIDFELFLKLSQGQCLLIEESACRYFGSRLPDRTTVVLGSDSGMLVADKLVKDLDEGLEFFRQTEHRELVAVGFTQKFNRAVLRVADRIYLNQYETSADMAYPTMPDLDHEDWTLEFKEFLPCRPLYRTVGVNKYRYHRTGR